MSQDPVKTENEPKEVELLVYRGNNIPGIIKFVWVMILIFSIYYLTRYSWPDLKLWLNKSA